MKCESTIQWSLTGMDGQKGTAFSKYVPCRKIPGLTLPDTSNLHSVCAFNPETNETMTVLQFRTASNVYYGGWYNKVKRGWTLVKDFNNVGLLTHVTFPTTKKEELEDNDCYW